MWKHAVYAAAVVVVFAACGDVGSAGTTSTSSSTVATTLAPTTPTPTSIATTSPPTTQTTNPPDVGEWNRVAMERPISPSCCAEPVIGPASPTAQLPAEGWPSDGFYAITARRPPEPASRLDIVLSRWVSCSDLPDRCPPDSPIDGVTADPDTEVTGVLDLDGAVTVVIWPLWDPPADLDPSALVGSGADFAKLLVNGIDQAFTEYVLEPYRAGVPVEAIVDELAERSTDPTFRFVREESTSAFMYRGPLGSLLTAEPTWLLETADRWPPGPEGHYTWWMTLEIRDGAPVLHVFADAVAG